MVGSRGAKGRVRVLVTGAVREGDVVPLDEDEAHHLRVRRAKDGETVDLLNGAGLGGEGVLVGEPRGWSVRVIRARVAMPGPETVIAVAAGDRDRFSWMAEKLGELGATDLVPLETTHTGAVASRIRGAQLEKLRRRVLESTKQSGALWAVRIRDPITLEQLSVAGADGRAGASRWLADVDGDAPPAMLEGPQRVAVGPEGGFTGQERALLVGAGWRPVRLGAHTLRFETAAVAAAAWIATARERRRA